MIAGPSVEKVSAGITYTSGAAAILFGFTAQEVAAIVAAIVCVLSYVTGHAISFYFQQKKLNLLREAMERNTIMHLPSSEEACSVCRLSRRMDES